MKQGFLWNEDIGLCMKQFLIDFKLSFDDLIFKSVKGGYQFNNNPATIHKGFGIDIQISPDLSYDYTKFHVNVKNDKIELCDERGVLLNTYITIDPVHMNYYLPETSAKIFVNGFNIVELMHYQFLLEIFNIENVTSELVEFNSDYIKSKVRPTKIVSELLEKLELKQPEPEEIPQEIIEEKVDTSFIDSFISEMTNLTEEDLKSMINPSLFDMNIEQSDVKDLYSEMDLELDPQFVSQLMEMVSPTHKYENKVFTIRDPSRLDEMPYKFYLKHFYTINFSIIQIISMLKFHNYSKDWQFYFLIFLANSMVVSKNIAGKLDQNIHFDVRPDEVFSF
jgi:hypothetical protein